MKSKPGVASHTTRVQCVWLSKMLVEEYLCPWGRFKQLFGSQEGAVELRHLQALADARIRRYGLLDADTQWDTDIALHGERQGRGGYSEERNHGA